jgi:hypothetical protein
LEAVQQQLASKVAMSASNLVATWLYNNNNNNKACALKPTVVALSQSDTFCVD